MWLKCRSCDSDCGHMIIILGPIKSCDHGSDASLDTSEIKMADKVSLSFSSLYHKYHWIIMDLCLQNSFKNNIMDIYTPYEVNKAAGKQNFQFLVSKVVDSQQWRISPSNGGSVFDKV